MPDDAILTAAKNLASAIKTSAIYAGYIRALETIRQNPQLETRVSFFKKARAEMADTLADDKALSQRYRELLNDPDIAAFFAAEERYLKVYTEMLGVIDKELEMEMF